MRNLAIAGTLVLSPMNSVYACYTPVTRLFGTGKNSDFCIGIPTNKVVGAKVYELLVETEQVSRDILS